MKNNIIETKAISMVASVFLFLVVISGKLEFVKINLLRNYSNK